MRHSALLMAQPRDEHTSSSLVSHGASGGHARKSVITCMQGDIAIPEDTELDINVAFGLFFVSSKHSSL